MAAQLGYALPLLHQFDFSQRGALRVSPGTRLIRWSGSFGGTCLGLSRVPFALLSLINYFYAERMHYYAVTCERHTTSVFFLADLQMTV